LRDSFDSRIRYPRLGGRVALRGSRGDASGGIKVNIKFGKEKIFLIVRQGEDFSETEEGL
jgi:hypothetical protein